MNVQDRIQKLERENAQLNVALQRARNLNNPYGRHATSRGLSNLLEQAQGRMEAAHADWAIERAGRANLEREKEDLERKVEALEQQVAQLQATQGGVFINQGIVNYTQSNTENNYTQNNTFNVAHRPKINHEGRTPKYKDVCALETAGKECGDFSCPHLHADQVERYKDIISGLPANAQEKRRQAGM